MSMPALAQAPRLGVAGEALPEDQSTCISGSSLPRIASAARGWRSKPPGSISTTPRTGSPTRHCDCCLQLASESGLRERIDAMFRGDKINVSENRAVLHVALRAPRGAPSCTTARTWCPRSMPFWTGWLILPIGVRSGAWKGHTGKRIRNVINIGIGGSDLGPVMAYEALKHYSERAMTFRFVSNVDGTDFAEAVARSRSRGDVVHRLLQDLHHAGDDDQRAHRARLAAGGLERRRNRRRQTFRRRLDQCRRGREVRHRHRQHVRLLGLGRRPLFDGFGHRPLDHAGHRPGQFPRHARRLP